MPTAPPFADLLEAAARIAPYAHRTPVLTCSAIDDLVGARVFFKCENLQKVGAFKFRGATNAVLSLSEAEAGRGVATHSSGNHGAAVALAARTRGIPAHIVMPENSSEAKKKAVAGYGGRIRYCGPTTADRERAIEEVLGESGAVLIHPYNDERIIAGQGTAALELLDEVAELDMLVTPVGGGGMLSGTAIAARSRSPGSRVIGAEPRGADDAWRSLRAGRLLPGDAPQTIADGLRTGLGDITFAVINQAVDDILTVTEPGIVSAMRTIWERMKIVVEPSAAVTLGALLEHRASLRAARIGVILTGGNVDLDALPWR